MYNRNVLCAKYYYVNFGNSSEFKKIHSFIKNMGHNSLYDIWGIDKDDYTYDVILARANRGLKGIEDKNSDKYKLYSYCQSVFSSDTTKELYDEYLLLLKCQKLLIEAVDNANKIGGKIDSSTYIDELTYLIGGDRELAQTIYNAVLDENNISSEIEDETERRSREKTEGRFIESLAVETMPMIETIRGIASRRGCLDMTDIHKSIMDCQRQTMRIKITEEKSVPYMNHVAETAFSTIKSNLDEAKNTLASLLVDNDVKIDREGMISLWNNSVL